ncbi:hypothetical protein Tco_1265349 [Tanacetum coccineum]
MITIDQSQIAITYILITSPKIDFLPEEFVGELDLIDPILSGIDEDDCDKDDFDEEEGGRNDDGYRQQIRGRDSSRLDTHHRVIESDFDSKRDIIFSNDLLNDDPIPEYERFTFDIEPDAPVINNFDELNKDECFDPGEGEIDVSQNIEDDDSFLKIFSGKLKTRWLGPFTITQVFPYGTVKLSEPDGLNFKVNGHRVKHYFEGDIPSKLVPDLQTIPIDN